MEGPGALALRNKAASLLSPTEPRTAPEHAQVPLLETPLAE